MNKGVEDKMEFVIEYNLDQESVLKERKITNNKISDLSRSEYNNNKLKLINRLIKKLPKTKLDIIIKFSKYYDQNFILFENKNENNNNKLLFDFMKNYNY